MHLGFGLAGNGSHDRGKENEMHTLLRVIWSIFKTRDTLIACDWRTLVTAKYVRGDYPPHFPTPAKLSDPVEVIIGVWGHQWFDAHNPLPHCTKVWKP